MLFRTTSVQDDSTWRTTQFNSLVPCWMQIISMNWAWVSREYITELCSTFYTTFWVTAKLQRVGYPMKFPRCNNGTAKQSDVPAAPLRPALRRIRRHLVVQNRIILHDNASGHTATVLTDLLRRWKWEILEHPPYSPDMSSCERTTARNPVQQKRFTNPCYMAVNTKQQIWTRWWCTMHSTHLVKGDNMGRWLYWRHILYMLYPCE